jgi:hypothetical protein
MSLISRFSAFSLALLAAGYANAQAGAVEVPAKLSAGVNESLAMIAAAKGVQIYECRLSKDAPGKVEWTFVAPEADLFDARGAKIGRHYAGPHWEANDGSNIQGTTKERADAPVKGAIPWLLLSAKSVGPKGTFDRVTSVQRVNTAGGVAPEAESCTPPSIGRVARVPYTADYYFFTTFTVEPMTAAY